MESLGACGGPVSPEPGLGRKLGKSNSKALILSSAVVVSQLKGPRGVNLAAFFKGGRKLKHNLIFQQMLWLSFL